MKTFFLMLLALLSTNINGQENSRNDTIKVISFNIRLGIADDGQNSWKFRKSILFDYLKDVDADIIGIQEAFKFQINEILDKFNHYAYIGKGRDDGKEAGEYSAILFKKNKFKNINEETFWFSETPDIPGSIGWGNTITRICTWGRFVILNNQIEFDLYNLHLDHISQISREKSVELLLKKIKQNSCESNIIITGDFNCSEENHAIRNVLHSKICTGNRVISDSFRELNPEYQNAGTFHDFNGTRNENKIDYIFYSGNMKIISSQISYFAQDHKFPSDHFPVEALILIIN